MRLRGELRERFQRAELSRSQVLDQLAVEGVELSRRQLEWLLTERRSIPPRDVLEPLCRVAGLTWSEAVDLL